jgi:hypothetical protein
MAPTRKAAAAVVRPGEGSPTPAEVYQAALLAGRTEDEAHELSEQRAIELAGGVEGEAHAAGGLLTLDDVPDDADDASVWLDRINDLVNTKHPGCGWVPIERMATERDTGAAEQMIERPEPEAWDPEHCPTPKTCFPYLTTDAAAAVCIHGTSTRATRES